MSIPPPITSNPLPEVTVTETSRDATRLEVTPVWFESVDTVPATEINLPPSYNQNSRDVQTYDCLARFRKMNNTAAKVDFVAKPFVPAAEDTETMVVVMNELIQQLGASLTFTTKEFNYEDSAYRTACGIADMGSIHSLIASGESVQAANFKLHMNLNYEEVVSNPGSIKNFTVHLTNDISKVLDCKPEYIRVLSIERTNAIEVKIYLTTPDPNETKRLADKLKQILSDPSVLNGTVVLCHVSPYTYNYEWKTVISHLQLQPSDFDPRFNRAYPNDDQETRGGRPYYFPKGWYRHALKVENKYPHDKLWLGMNNSPGEWCVAFHGTKGGVVRSIIDTGLQHKFVTADACKAEAEQKNPSIPKVKGLYVADHCEDGASLYTADFPVSDPSRPGVTKNYRIVFQCRVQNEKFTEHSGPVSVGLAYRVFDEKAIRPYGVLLKTT